MGWEASKEDVEKKREGLNNEAMKNCTHYQDGEWGLREHRGLWVGLVFFSFYLCKLARKKNLLMGLHTRPDSRHAKYVTILT